ncbi:MAG: transcriptional repressor [Chthoniobacterales bacterium]|nr:transcriptional repressor [Chthoniobacterales bacterium]
MKKTTLLRNKEVEDLTYERALVGGGLRLTPQRRQVFDVLMEKRDHPTAVEVYERAKVKMPSISLATVYNCLEKLVDCGLVRQVHIEREPVRYCPNLSNHAHFVCTECKRVMDVPVNEELLNEKFWKLPRGFRIRAVETTILGVCAQCSAKKIQE